jgi:hypothetical protein
MAFKRSDDVSSVLREFSSAAHAGKTEIHTFLQE